jgi:diguanylate cyclase (GGDEF)-like protein
MSLSCDWKGIKSYIIVFCGIIYDNNRQITYWNGGTEEFIAIITEMNEDALLKKAEKLRMLIENAKLRSESNELRVTISIGVAIINDEDTIDSIIQRADKMLYKSKQNGRNLVSFA